MFCHNCGTNCPDDSAFCPNCGEYIKTTEVIKNSIDNMKDDTLRDSSADSKSETFNQDPTVKVYNVSVPAVKKRIDVKKLVLIIVLSICIFAVVVFGVLATFHFKNGDTDESQPEQSTLESMLLSVDDSTAQTSSAPSKLTSKYLVGNWAFNMPADRVISLLKDAPESFTTETKLPMIMRFAEDKTVSVVCKAEDYKNTFLSVVSDYAEYLKNGGIYDEYELSHGYTREQVDEMMAEYGMTPELMAEKFEQEMNTKDPFGGATIVDGLVYFTSTEKQTEYTLDGKTITFVTDKDISRETYFDFEYGQGAVTVTEGDYANGILNGICLTKQE